MTQTASNPSPWQDNIPVLNKIDTGYVPSDAPGRNESGAIDTFAAEPKEVAGEDTSRIKDGSPVPASSAPNFADEKGLVISADNKKPVGGASVLLIGEANTYTANADRDGFYAIKGIVPGAYQLKASKKGFSVLALESLEIVPGVGPVRELQLERSILKGQLIEVKGVRKGGSEASLMSSRKSAGGILEGVSSEQISKSTDSDAGAIAKRVTGTSLVGGKYIYVRGLGERYTNMTMNGLPVPSPEKDKRVVPQDLFPASALESFSIYKTFSPELYSDFAGGSVALSTKGIPDKRFLKLSLGTGGTDIPGDGKFLDWGEKRLTYEGGNTFWGYDDGTRAKPDGVPINIPIRQDSEVEQYKQQGLPAYTREERAGFSSRFNNIYALDTGEVLPKMNMSLAAGNVHKTSDDGRWGYLLNAGFKNEYDQEDIRRVTLGIIQAKEDSTYFHPILQKEISVTKRYYFDTLPDGTVKPVKYVVPGLNADISRGTYEATLTGLANVGFENADHYLFLKNFFVNIGSDVAAYTLSRQDPSGVIDQSRPVEERYLLEFERRALLAHQAGGGHYLGLGVIDSASWALGFARSESETPDSRKYRYVRQALDGPFEYINVDVWGTRIFDDFSEESWAGRSDLFWVIPPYLSARDTFAENGFFLSHLSLPKGSAGITSNFRSRDFKTVRFGYADPTVHENREIEDIREPDSLEAQIKARKSDFYTTPKEYDEYTAREWIHGGYAKVEWGLRTMGIPLGFDIGTRIENYRMELIAPYTGTQFGEDKQRIDSAIVTIQKDQLNFFPSLGMSVEFIPDTKTRLLYSRTQVRPEFREIAPFRYINYLSGRSVYGNPDLKNTDVTHWDFRFDWFFPYRQLLSFSLFRKDFLNPVEEVAKVNSGGTPGLGYQNAKSAFVRGVEMEGEVSLEYLASSLGLNHPLWKGWTFYGNVALMESRVELDTARLDSSTTLTQSGDLTSLSRPMVGQSPYLVNMKLTNQFEWGRTQWLNGLLFNVSGQRIIDVGDGGVPDLYEMPFPRFDYLGKIGWGRHELSFKVKNILNSRKRMLGFDENPDKDYHTLTEAERNNAFPNAQYEHVVQLNEAGIAYDVGYSLTF